MKTDYVQSTLILTVLVFCFLFEFPFFISMCHSEPVNVNQAKEVDTNENLTPGPGNPLRKAILDSLRAEIKKMHGLDVVFVVKFLKVKDGWAWIRTLPQSQDGLNHYEDISALLQKSSGVWKVAEIPCMETENPNCLDAPDYFIDLRKRFTDVPPEILPHNKSVTAMEEGLKNEPSFTSTITGCAGSSTKESSLRSSGNRKEQGPEIHVSDSTIHYSRVLRHQCCRSVELQYRIEESKIEIIEIWTGQGCRCLCFSEVIGAVEHLQSGTYEITVRMTGTKPTSDAPLQEKILLSQSVNIKSDESIVIER